MARRRGVRVSINGFLILVHKYNRKYPDDVTSGTKERRDEEQSLLNTEILVL